MSQTVYSANLSSDDIPLLHALQGNTVIVGKIDQDYTLEVNNSQKLQREKRIPQAFYCHNVMPTGQGYQSIGYVEKIPMFAGHVDFDQAFVLRDPDENKFLFSPAGGMNYIFDRNVETWASVSPIVNAQTALVTVAYIEGDTYIFYRKIGCFKYNSVTRVLDPVTLIGLTINQINGICSANGFLLAWDDGNVVYRAQAADILNFTPDPSLGSGSGVPEDIRGKIVVLLPITNGFIVYTTANAVAAIFQQNIRYPFIYKEVEASSGIVEPGHVSWQDNLGEHYAWTISGLQKLNKTKAIPIFPEITDFLVAKIFEDFNSTTWAFEVQEIAQQLNVHVTVCGSRFVVISYGITSPQFTHAIVYDLAFKRFGKAKITHVDCFTFFVPNLSGDVEWDTLGSLVWDDFGSTTWDDLATQVTTRETPKEVIAFMGQDGQIQIVNFDLIHNNDDGVLICGKYQFTRERIIGLDELSVQNMKSDAVFSVRILPTMDGKNFLAPVTPYAMPFPTGSLTRDYRSKVNGLNHSLAFKGTFNFTSLELTFHEEGKPR